MTTVCSHPSTNHCGYMDYSFSRHANSAGLALPRIPRRTSSTNSARSTPAVQATLSRSPSTPPSAKVVVQPPTPPEAAQKASSTPPKASSLDISSGSGSDALEMLVPKPRRTPQRSSLPSYMRPPEHSTPTPAILHAKADKESRIPFPVDSSLLDATPRASAPIVAPIPRPCISPLTTLNKEGIIPSRSASASITSLGHKKSGQPLKSSLKSRRPVVRGDLSVITGPISIQSAPTTPTGIKSVHFDRQLEHVKLFLAEQKPLAVSRDGSPTDDTSGTESDFPAFIYGEDKENKTVLGLVTNGLRAESVEERERTDVKLEQLVLGEEGTLLVGHVRVKNLAYEKWVAVRFTSDSWQTTSEVTAKYFESIPSTNGQHDRFQFSIRLNDMLNRIEDKTMVLAVRYATAGREIWDNNGGQNYEVKFTKKRVPVATKKTVDDSGRAAGIAVLKSKLEKVAQDDEHRSTVGGFLSSRSQRSQSLSPPVAIDSPTSSPRNGYEDRSFTLKSNTSLSSRYDFGASLKNNWRRTASLETPAGTIPEHSRNRTHPNTLPQFPRRTPAEKRTIVELTRGSPRMFDEANTSFPSGFSMPSDFEAAPVPALSRKNSRNHQRGYFDLGVSPSAHGVRRTPPGSPFGPPGMGGSPSGSGRNSPVPLTQEASAMWRVASGGSEDTTPPSSAGNEESSRDSSPNTSPYEGPVTLAPDVSFPRSPSPDDQSSYSAFLNNFCFFTGSESLNDFSEMHRSHSASSVEEFLSTSPYLGSDYLSPGHTPTRSSSFDDVVTISGDATPTPRSLASGAPSTFASPPSVATFAL